MTKNPSSNKNPVGKGTEKDGAAIAREVDSKLLDLLVCPLTKSTLHFDAAKNCLISRSGKLAFPIRDGIPIMLPSEATALDEEPLKSR